MMTERQKIVGRTVREAEKRLANMAKDSSLHSRVSDAFLSHVQGKVEGMTRGQVVGIAEMFAQTVVEAIMPLLHKRLFPSLYKRDRVKVDPDAERLVSTEEDRLEDKFRVEAFQVYYEQTFKHERDLTLRFAKAWVASAQPIADKTIAAHWHTRKSSAAGVAANKGRQ